VNRAALFLIACTLGGLGGMLGSIVGSAFGKAGMWAGGVVWRDSTGIPAIPQLIVLERVIGERPTTDGGGSRPYFGPERVVQRFLSANAIARWVLQVADSTKASTPPSLNEGSDVIVHLDRVVDSSPSPLGNTNIFFAPPPPEIQRAMRTGEGWTGVQIADVVMGERLETIYAARFKMPGSDQMHYVIDTAGNLDFAHGQPLTFEPHPHLLVARLDLDVHTTRGAHRRIPYQVMVSDDGYTYARIAEYLTGRIPVGGKDYAVKIRSAYRFEPFYSPGPGTVFLIDLDGNGEIAEKPSVTRDGAPAAAEQVMARTPFLLGKQAWMVADVDSMGSRLVIRRTKTKVAAVENFKAPRLVARTLSGRSYQLSKQSDVVLVEFWSVSCGFCEKARPAVNELAYAERGRFTWLAVARETDRSEIKRFLAAHPMNATVALYDSAAWTTYNPIGVTPLFFVVDKKGVIRFRGAGASALDAAAAKVKMLSPVSR
jgi:thiol-disulfide isomerase/thioredoxin